MADGAGTSGCKPTTGLLLTLTSPPPHSYLTSTSFYEFLERNVMSKGKNIGSRNGLRRNSVVLTLFYLSLLLSLIFCLSLCFNSFFTKYFHMNAKSQELSYWVCIMWKIQSKQATMKVTGRKGGSRASSWAWVDNCTYVCVQVRKCANVRNGDRKKKGAREIKEDHLSHICDEGSAG